MGKPYEASFGGRAADRQFSRSSGLDSGVTTIFSRRELDTIKDEIARLYKENEELRSRVWNLEQHIHDLGSEC